MDYKSLAIEAVNLYGYMALFVTMFVDTLGIPMPSKTMLVLSGYFINMGIFDLQKIFVVALAGTLGGFTCGYTIGRRLGIPFIEKFGKYFFMSPEKICKLEDWFARFGVYAIVIAYFLPVARSAVPYLSGIGKMPFTKALMFATIGATSWIISLMLFGYFIAQNQERIISFLMQYYPYLIAGVLVIAVALYVARRNRRNKQKSKQPE